MVKRIEAEARLLKVRECPIEVRRRIFAQQVNALAAGALQSLRHQAATYALTTTRRIYSDIG